MDYEHEKQLVEMRRKNDNRFITLLLVLQVLMIVVAFINHNYVGNQ